METTKTIRIMLDFIQGPVWLSDFDTGEPMTGIPVVDNDPIVRELNYACADLFNSYYEFNSHDQACWVDLERQKADKGIMLDMITRLIDRLNEINDGSYVIEDCETERIKNL